MAVNQYRVFIGYDPRQPLGYNVLQHSIVRYASEPVSITPLILSQLPLKRRGLTEFTFSRFLVPYLCDYVGTAIFMDADIVVKGDIVELFKTARPSEYSVQVMQDQPRFEWPSVMLFNNMCCRQLTPAYVDDEANNPYEFEWAKDRVGSFPAEWNHCVGYQTPKEAKLYHYTQGLPCWMETAGLPENGAWLEEHADLTKTVSWKELMGRSVHAKPVLKRLFEYYTS
jgi:hypothetical protein